MARARGAPIGDGVHGRVYSVVGDDGAVVKASTSTIFTDGGALREIALLSMFNHPNVVRIDDAALDGVGRTLLVAERCDTDVERVTMGVARRLVPYTYTAFASIAYQLLCGVAHVHARHVVHNDIKPSNVFACDGMMRVVIGDFSIAQPYCDWTRGSSRTSYAAYFRPPEVWDSDDGTNGEHGCAADIWALGTTLHWIATGAPWTERLSLSAPFYEMTREQRRAVMEEYFGDRGRGTRWTQELQHAPADVADLLVRMINVTPSKRSTANALLLLPYFDAHRIYAIETPAAPLPCADDDGVAVRRHNEWMRVCVEWLQQVHTTLSLSTLAWSLAMNYIRRAVEHVEMERVHVQGFVVAALALAVIVCESAVIEPREWAALTDGATTTERVEYTVVALTRLLNFELFPPCAASVMQ